MGTVACCWCHKNGGGGNSATVDREGCESYRPERRRSGLGEMLRNQLTRYGRRVDEVRYGRCEIRQQNGRRTNAHRQHGICMARTTRRMSRKVGTETGTGLGKRSDGGLSFRSCPA